MSYFGESYAKEVAEAIYNEAQSGSAVWDELGGPSAELTEVSPGKFTVTLPKRWLDEDENEPTGPACRITVEEVAL